MCKHSVHDTDVVVHLNFKISKIFLVVGPSSNIAIFLTAIKMTQRHVHIFLKLLAAFWFYIT